jgi:hypothetical protein
MLFIISHLSFCKDGHWSKKCFIEYNNKNLDIQFSEQSEFHRKPSSCILKIEGLERQIIKQNLLEQES